MLPSLSCPSQGPLQTLCGGLCGLLGLAHAIKTPQAWICRIHSMHAFSFGQPTFVRYVLSFTNVIPGSDPQGGLSGPRCRSTSLGNRPPGTAAANSCSRTVSGQVTHGAMPRLITASSMLCCALSCSVQCSKDPVLSESCLLFISHMT